jgi:sterol 14-demethylase
MQISNTFTQEYFARWGQSGTVDLKQELEHLVTLVASRCLFGEEVRSKMLGEVATHLRELNDGMRLVTILFPHLPIPAHRRRDRARARLGEIFSDIVRSRKESMPESGGRNADVDDMLQCLIDSRYKDGRGTTETEVVGMLVSALFAGQHTSSSTGTWTGARLLVDDNVAHLQRYGPGRFGVPGRGADDRAGAGAFAYTAFGGGRHACVGEAFAYMQIKVIWSHLLRNFEMKMVSPFPETDWNVVMPGLKGKVTRDGRCQP